MKRLHKTMNRAIRYILNAPKSQRVTPLYKQLKWLKLRDRQLLHSMVMVYKIIYLPCPSYVMENIQILQSARNGLQLHIPRHSTTFYSKFFFIRACREWNALPANIRSSKTLSEFKRLLTDHLLNKY